MKDLSAYNPQHIHERVCDNFSVRNMTDGYLRYYEQVMNGQTLHTVAPKVDSLESDGFFTMTD